MRPEQLRDVILAGHLDRGAVRLHADDHHRLCESWSGRECDCYALPFLPAREAFAALLTELERLQDSHDALQMTQECSHEIMVEWATQARSLVPEDFDFGHGCASCTITRVLDHLAGLRRAEAAA